jgi:hypothetical protein
MREGWSIANQRHEAATVHVRHRQIDQHQVGLKCPRDFQCRDPAIGDMDLVAEFFR